MHQFTSNWWILPTQVLYIPIWARGAMAHGPPHFFFQFIYIYNKIYLIPLKKTVSLNFIFYNPIKAFRYNFKLIFLITIQQNGISNCPYLLRRLHVHMYAQICIHDCYYADYLGQLSPFSGTIFYLCLIMY